MRSRTFTIALGLMVVIGLAPLVEAQLGEEYADWDKGPEGFLLTKKERKEWKEITADGEAKRFIELFWARRDPNLETPFNEFQLEFERRVAHADEEYATDRTRGALSDRAKVLVLLGYPHKAEHRGATETVTLLGDQASGTDEVRENAKMWFYDPALLPARLKIKGSRLLFVFYERKAETNDFILDRSHNDATLALRALSKAPDVHFLHPDLKEVPKPVSVSGGEAATAALLAWLEEESPAWNDRVEVVLEVGVADANFLPYWAQVKLPVDAPPLDRLAGRVSSPDGDVVSTFQIAAEPLDARDSRVYHLTFPLQAGTYDIAFAGSAGAEVLFTYSAPIETSEAPAEGTWMSPIWFSLSAEREAEILLGKAYCFGGWHVIPFSGGEVKRSDELSYFGFVARPQTEEGAEPSLKTKIVLKQGEKRLGQPLSFPLPVAALVEDLYLFANSLSLSALPEAGEYTLEITITDTASAVATERQISFNIVE